MIKILKFIKNIVDPNYWAEKIGMKSGLYEWSMKSPLRKWALSLEGWKSGLYQWSMKSSLREWALGLTGWKWWAWQLGPCLLIFILLELLLNWIGMTMLPWK